MLFLSLFFVLHYLFCVFVLRNFEYVSKKLYLWEHEKIYS